MDEGILSHIASLDLDTDPFINLDNEDKEYLIGLVYDTISGYLSGGNTAGQDPYPAEYDNITNEVHVVIRIDGR